MCRSLVPLLGTLRKKLREHGWCHCDNIIQLKMVTIYSVFLQSAARIFVILYFFDVRGRCHYFAIMLRELTFSVVFCYVPFGVITLIMC